jgi:hypothetical protein
LIFIPLIVINGIANLVTYHLHSKQRSRFEMAKNLDSKLEILEQTNKNLLYLAALLSLKHKQSNSEVDLNTERQSDRISATEYLNWLTHSFDELYTSAPILDNINEFDKDENDRIPELQLEKYELKELIEKMRSRTYPLIFPESYEQTKRAIESMNLTAADFALARTLEKHSFEQSLMEVVSEVTSLIGEVEFLRQFGSEWKKEPVHFDDSSLDLVTLSNALKILEESEGLLA